VELSNIVLSKEMKKRFQIKKAIAKKSKITQMEKKVRKLVRFRNEYNEHRKQNNEEMLAIWKNMELLFRKV
jgi:pyruvoyl-dependent arginine decarboxylase (PvlArgDC)